MDNWIVWVVVLGTLLATILLAHAAMAQHQKRKKIFEKEKSQPIPRYVVLGVSGTVILYLLNIIQVVDTSYKELNKQETANARNESIDCTISNSVDRMEDIILNIYGIQGAIRSQDSSFQRSSQETFSAFGRVLEELKGVGHLTEQQTQLLDSTSGATVEALRIVHAEVGESIASLDAFVNDAEMLIFPLHGIRVKFVVCMDISEQMAKRFSPELEMFVDELFSNDVREDGRLTKSLYSPWVDTRARFKLVHRRTGDMLVEDADLTRDVKPLYQILGNKLYLFYDCPVNGRTGLIRRSAASMKDVEECSFGLELVSNLYLADNDLVKKVEENPMQNTNIRLVKGIVISLRSNVESEVFFADSVWHREYKDDGPYRFDAYSSRMRAFRYEKSVLETNAQGVPRVLLPVRILE